jgi:hypothetical protein
VSAVVRLAFARLCASVVDSIRSQPSAWYWRARWAPRRFGTRTLYRTPGVRVIDPMTASASVSWGTASGRTKDVTWMRPTPVRPRASMTATLSGVAIVCFSSWKPSRGPTSLMTTRGGRAKGSEPGRLR